MSLDNFITLEPNSDVLSVSVAAVKPSSTTVARDCVFRLTEKPVDDESKFQGLLHGATWTEVQLRGTILKLQGVTSDKEACILQVYPMSAEYGGGGPRDTVKALVALLGADMSAVPRQKYEEYLEATLFCKLNPGQCVQDILFTEKHLMPQ